VRFLRTDRLPQHDEDRAKCRPEVVDRTLQYPTNLAAGSLTLGRRLHHRRQIDLAADPLLHRVDLSELHLQTLPALAPQRLIERDPRHPCSQVRFATKVDDFRERVQVGLLDDDFGFLVVAQDMPRAPR